MFATDSDIHATVDDDLICLAEFGSIRGKGSDCGVVWSDPLLLCLSFTVYPEECWICLAHCPRGMDVIELVGKGVRSHTLTVLDGEPHRVIDRFFWVQTKKSIHSFCERHHHFWIAGVVMGATDSVVSRVNFSVPAGHHQPELRSQSVVRRRPALNVATSTGKTEDCDASG